MPWPQLRATKRRLVGTKLTVTGIHDLSQDSGSIFMGKIEKLLDYAVPLLLGVAIGAMAIMLGMDLAP